MCPTAESAKRCCAAPEEKDPRVEHVVGRFQDSLPGFLRSFEARSCQRAWHPVCGQKGFRRAVIELD